MQALTVTEVLLISDLEKKARKVPFDPEMTVILGKNDTGKSSLLKSIYATFGAEPAVTHPKWANAQVTSVVRFRIAGSAYAILRRGRFFGLFDGIGNLLGSFDKVTAGLGVKLAELFDFHLKLYSKAGELVTPPPAYFFLPFYIDQDAGWKQNWSSFARLGQLKDWRRSVAEYHTGLKPNEYYLVKAELDAVQSAAADAERELRILATLYERAEQAAHHALFDINLEAFRGQVEGLIGEVERLRELENRLKGELVELHNQRIEKEEQIRILDQSRRELSADLAFATDELGGGSFPCPACGTVYQNSFGERLAIAEDEDRVDEMLVEAQFELRHIQERIAAEHRKFTNQRDEVARVERALRAELERMTLAELIQNEGRRELRSMLQKRMAETKREISGKTDRVKHLRKEMKGLTDRTRTENILGRYRARMRSYLQALGVLTLPEKAYESIDANIRETGSDLPRALLAYYFSVFHVIRDFSSSTVCPLVIDSPNQQAQDPESLRTMLRFINDNQPAQTQVVLGLEDVYDVEFRGKLVELHEKYNLLRDDEYEAVREEVLPLLRTSLTI